MSEYGECLQISAECTVEGSVYGFYPSLAANSFFLAFFALFFVLNLSLGVCFKTWTYSVCMCLACILEAIGYGGRLMLHNNPYSKDGFIMQICCLIMGPAINSAAIYLTLKYITLEFGSEWSRIKPWLYTWIFIGGDLIALVLQAIGGAMASTANDTDQLKKGDNIAMAGISWQVFTLLVFGITTVDYVVRRWRSATPLGSHASTITRRTSFRLFVTGISIAWLTIFVRCVFRIVEFAKGWGNPVMRNEHAFIALESVMIVIATFCQTVPHPGYCFPALSSRKRAAPVDEPKIVDASTNSSVNVVVERKSAP